VAKVRISEFLEFSKNCMASL